MILEFSQGYKKKILLFLWLGDGDGEDRKEEETKAEGSDPSVSLQDTRYKVHSDMMFVQCFVVWYELKNSVAVQVSRGFVQLAGRAAVREQRCRRRQESSLEERTGYLLTNVSTHPHTNVYLSKILLCSL